MGATPAPAAGSDGEGGNVVSSASNNSQGPIFPHYANTLTWEQSLSNLKAYKAHYGHCNVPRSRNCNEYPKLGNWVKKQRKKKKNPGKKYEVLTADQIHELDKLGFQWNLRDYPLLIC